MKDIPTAEDFMNSEQFEPDQGISFSDYHGYVADGVPDMMVQFTKIHLKAAVLAIHRNMQLPLEDLEFTMSAYPLENIK